MKHLLLIIITAFFCSQVSAQITLERSDWSSTYISGGRNGFKIISTVGEFRINENTLGQTHLSEGFISPGIKSVVSTINDETNSFVIYPNPTTGPVFLSNNTGNNYHLQLISIDGRLIWSKKLNALARFHMDLSSLPANIYMIKLINDQTDEIVIVKLVKL